MRYRRLKNTDLDVSAICLGGAEFGSAIDAPAAFELLDAYVEQGGNFLDTANFYGRWHGAGDAASERVIGRWMRERGNRAALVLATKGGHPEFSPHFETRPLVHRLAPEQITADLEDSLANLGTDYVDLYWLHYDDPARPVGDMLETLDAHRRAGRIRHYGCANWSAARIAQAQAYCSERGLAGFVANQMLWNLAAHNRAALWVDGMQAMTPEMRALHRGSSLAAVPYSAQAGGYFSKAQQDDFLDRPEYLRLRACYQNAETTRRVARVGQFARDSGHEPTQIALACLMNQPFDTVPIVGARTPRQLEASMAAQAIALDKIDIAFLAGR